MIKKVIAHYKKYRKDYLTKLKNEKNKKQRLKMQIPNILTSSRILAPLLLLPSALMGNFILSTIIATILGLTDCLDGFLARKWQVTSEYGQKLDAISDKLFAVGIAIPIIFTNPLIILPVIFFEVLIGCINLNSYLKGNNPKSTILGKIKTIFLYILLSSIYLTKALNISFLPIKLLILTNFLQIATTVQYGYIDKIKETKPDILKNEINNIDEDFSVSPYKKQIEELKVLKESLTQNKKEEKIKVYTKTPRK